MRWPWERSERDFVERSAGQAAPDTVAAEYANAPQGDVTTIPAGSGAFGVDDTWYADLLAGGPDVNPLLSGRAKYQVYNEMRLSDATVRSCLWMFKLPIRAADWRVVPASDDPIDEMIAEFVAWQFGLEGDKDQGRLDLTWDESLQQALLHLDWGAMFEEMVWAPPETWTDADGDEHTVRPLARLAPRFPSSIIQAGHDPQTGGLGWVQQDLPGAKPIPGDKLCYYALDREGHNWWGTSLLRPMYGAWRLKKALMINAGIGWDRHAVGTPVVRYPTGGGPAARQQAEQIARSYRVHERGYVVLEGPPAQSTGGGNNWDIDILNGATSLADPVPLMKEFDIQIATAGLQMFARLGLSSTGNRAVGEILSDPFYQAVQAIAKSIASVRMRHAVRELVNVNFGREYDVPKFEVSKIQGKNVQVLAAAIGDLSAAGLSFTDPDTQNDIRAQLDLSDLPDELAGTLEGLPPTVGVDQTIASSAPGGPAITTEDIPLDDTGGGVVGAV